MSRQKKGHLFGNQHPKESNTNAFLNKDELLLLTKNKIYLNTNKLRNKSEQKCMNKNTAVNPNRLLQMSLDYEQIKPRDLIRSLNCKPDVEYSMNEIYPNIKPPISKCSPSQSSKWLAESLKDAGCGKFFSMEKDDVIEIWKSSPRKETICCYGVGSGIPGPDAVQFDITVGKCLEKVKQRAPRRSKLKSAVTMNAKKAARSSGPFILNRDLLSSTINRMPTVQEVMKASNTFNWQYCPQQPGSKPFIQSKARKDLNEERASQTKPCIKDRHRICGLMNAIPQNDCINYERLLKKKLDPSKVDKYEELEQMQRDLTMEPKNYDELYEQLVTCFERDPRKDSLSAAAKCCEKLFGDKHSTGDGGKGGDGGDKSGKGDEFESGHGDASGGKGAIGRRGKNGDGNMSGGKGVGKGESNDEGSGWGSDRNKGKLKGDGKGGDKRKGGIGGKGGKGGKGENKGGDGVGGKGGDGVGGKGGDGAGGKGGGDADSKKVGKLGGKTGDDQGSKGKTDQSIPGDIEPGMDIFRLSDTKILKTPINSGSDSKKKRSRRKPIRKKKQKTIEETPQKDCPCPICEFMNRRSIEEDPQFIADMMREAKQREHREYYKRMCHRERMKLGMEERNVPQHKCDPITCNNNFCYNNKTWAENIEKLDALNDVQRCLGVFKVSNEISRIHQMISGFKDKLCQRFSECL